MSVTVVLRVSDGCQRVSTSSHLLQDATFDTAGRDGAAALQSLNTSSIGHQERLIDRVAAQVTGMSFVHRIHAACHDRTSNRHDSGRRCAPGPSRPLPLTIAESCRPGNFILGEQIADFHFDEVEESPRSSTMSHLVQRRRRCSGTTDLTGEQDTCSRVWGMGPSPAATDDEDRSVHLRGARDHVLDVVRVVRDNRRARSGGSPTRTPRGKRRSSPSWWRREPFRPSRCPRS